MKRIGKRTVLLIIISVAVAFGGYKWHISEIDSLNKQLSEDQARNALMSQRIQEIKKQLTASETEKESLIDRVNELLAEDVVAFDSDAIMEEIMEIGELATVEYRYTNVGTLDASKKFSFVDCQIPYTRKTAVVTMDGVLKVGVDMSQVEIITDEPSKTISVMIPKAKILSNELFEDTMAVYLEEESLFNKINLDDSNSIRADIKSKAQQNALENSLLDQAQKKAGEIILYLIESIPEVKGTYTIVVR